MNLGDEPSAYEIWTKPDGWPAMSLAEVEAKLCGPGERFELETLFIRGVPTRVWKNAPHSLRHLADHARGHGERGSDLCNRRARPSPCS